MKNVLIVDDEKFMLQSMKRLLETERYQVMTALSADEALEILRCNKINIMISDENMPGIKGSALIAMVAETYPEIVSILVTAKPDLDSLVHALNEGHLFKFLTKPLNNDLLLKSLKLAAGKIPDEPPGAAESIISSMPIYGTHETGTRSIKILIADDSRLARSVLKKSINHMISADIVESADGADVLVKYEEFKPDIIFLDLQMPIHDGVDVLRKIRRSDKETIIIIVTANDNNPNTKLNALRSGATDFLHKPLDINELEARLYSLIELKQARDILKSKASLLKSQVHLSTSIIHERELETLRLLATAAESKDEMTGEHVQRVGTVSKIIAEKLGFDEEFSSLICHAAPLHDIGKIGISEALLNKTGKLTDEEFKEVQKHSEIGYNMLKSASSPYIKLGAEIAVSHHEKYDGTGYPRKLKGKDIPQSGRIVAVADVFDALIKARPYKEGWPIEKAIEYILQESGKSFDPEAAKAFESGLEHILEYYS